MDLSHPDHESKERRACTAESHVAISANETLFKARTSPCGYQDFRDVGEGVLELGICRNCSSTLARRMTEMQITMWSLAIGEFAR